MLMVYTWLHHQHFQVKEDHILTLWYLHSALIVHAVDLSSSGSMHMLIPDEGIITLNNIRISSISYWLSLDGFFRHHWDGIIIFITCFRRYVDFILLCCYILKNFERNTSEENSGDGGICIYDYFPASSFLYISGFFYRSLDTIFCQSFFLSIIFCFYECCWKFIFRGEFNRLQNDILSIGINNKLTIRLCDNWQGWRSVLLKKLIQSA